jgi:hypothetical protein
VRAVEAGLEPQSLWAEQAEGAARAAWEITEADPSTALLLVELIAYALPDDELRDLAEGLYDSYQGLAEHVVRILVTRSGRELRIPLEEVARLAVAGLNGVVLSFLVHGDQGRSRRDIENLVDLLRGGGRRRIGYAECASARPGRAHATSASFPAPDSVR